MITLAEVHTESARLALLRNDQFSKQWLELRSFDGQTLGVVPNEFLAQYSHWSPDGARLAFGSNDGRLYVVRPGEAEPTLVFSRPSLQAGFCEWAPQGNQLVFSAYDSQAQTPPDLYCVDLDTGQTRQLTNDPSRVNRFPHWSPDGHWVAFHRQAVDEPEMPMRVYVLNAQTGQCFPVLSTTGGYGRSGRHGWSADSSTVLVTHTDDNGVQLMAVRVADQAITWRYSSQTVQTGAFAPRGDRLLCVCSDELLWFSYPAGQLVERLALASLAPVRIAFTGPQIGFDRDPEVLYFLGANSCWYRWKIGAECACVLADTPAARPAYTHENYSVTARDGRSIPVQRFIPPDPKRPAILYVHGGPGEAINPDDPMMLRLLAEGIEFVCVAYRGSSGYGREHQEANRGEYGRADVGDVVAAGADWQTRFGNDRPLIVAGYSYGGFLTLLALAQANAPWAGGIVLWGVSGMHRLGPHAQRAWPADPAQLALARVERSPLEQARHIRGRLLIFHGARDTVATTAEMQSIQNSILAGGGECDLVVYPDGTHSLQQHRDEIHARVLGFLARWS